MIQPESFFHIGLTVPDLEASRRSLQDSIGLAWTDVTERKRQVWTASDGVQEVTFRVCHSLNTFRIELVEEVEGTIWTSPGLGTLHHLGYWAPDLEADSEHLTRTGFPLVARTETWVYHESPFGFYVELLKPRDLSQSGGGAESTK